MREIGGRDYTIIAGEKNIAGTCIEQAVMPKALEIENPRLKKMVADLSLYNGIVKEAAPGKLLSLYKRSSLF
jgi:hypothetical protein